MRSKGWKRIASPSLHLSFARQQPEDLRTAWEGFLAAIPWTTIWTLAPRSLLRTPHGVLQLATNILRTAEVVLSLDLAGLVVAERDASRAYHIHGLLRGDLDPRRFNALASRWGHSVCEPYRPGGGFIGYMASKLASGLEYTFFGDLEGENGHKK